MARKTKFDDKSKNELIKLVIDKLGLAKSHVTKLSYDELIAILSGKKSKSRSGKGRGKFPKKPTRKPRSTKKRNDKKKTSKKSKKVSRKLSKKRGRKSLKKKNIKKKLDCTCKNALMIEVMKNLGISLNKVLQMKVGELRKMLKEYHNNIFEKEKLTPEEELLLDEENLETSSDEDESDETESDTDIEIPETNIENVKLEDTSDDSSEDSLPDDDSSDESSDSSEISEEEIKPDEISSDDLDTDEERDEDDKNLKKENEDGENLKFSLEKLDTIFGADKWDSVNNTNEETLEKFKKIIKTKIDRKDLKKLLSDFGIDATINKNDKFEKEGYPLHLSKSEKDFFIEFEDNDKSQYFEIPISSKNKDNKYIQIFE